MNATRDANSFQKHFYWTSKKIESLKKHKSANALRLYAAFTVLLAN